MFGLYHTKRSVFLQFIGANTLIWNPNKEVAKKYHSVKDALREIEDLELEHVKPVSISHIVLAT